MRLSLIKERPSIRLMAPREVVIGQPFPVRVVLDCPGPVPVAGVDVELVGLTVWYEGDRENRQRQAARFCRARARVHGAGHLAAGHHGLGATFQLPWNLPGSYSGRWLRVEYIVNVRVAIPWWPDARASFVLHAIRPTASAREGHRVVYASSPDGPAGQHPYLEVSLAASTLEPGKALWGAVALSNVARNQYRALRFALFAVETIPGQVSGDTHHVPRTTWTVGLTQPEENERLEFRLALPADLTPGFSMHAAALAWFLEVRADMAWSLGPRLWIPVRIRAPGSTDSAMVQVPLAVGSQRLGLVWQEVAAATGCEFAHNTLSRVVGNTRIEVRREHRGRAGLVLVGNLQYPDLGIDLRLTSARGRQRLDARDAVQGEWLARRLLPFCRGLRIVRASDIEVEVELADTGQDVGRLRALVEQLIRLAVAIEAVRWKLPAPASVADRLPAWHAAARRLGGNLRKGRMAIVGRRGETRFELQTRWAVNGRPAGTLLWVRPPVPIDGRRQLRWTSGQGPLPGHVDFVPAEAWSGALELAVEREGIRVSLPEQTDLDGACGRLESLIALGHRLSGRAGPYR